MELGFLFGEIELNRRRGAVEWFTGAVPSSPILLLMDRKLVVLGIPWEVDSDGLREYMSRFGELEDCIVMKERSTGRSRGFGYVTFTLAEDAKSALSSEHILGNRTLEVKVATPKEEMRAPPKKVTRIFVARIPPSVTESTFRSHFEKYGEISDLYMPKDYASKTHRGIGFITYASADSVDNLMAESHELGGSTVVVDRATPKEEDFRPMGRMAQGSGGRMAQGGYGAYNAYISAATRYAAAGAPTLYDHPGSSYERGEYARGMGKKIFVGRLPQEASAEDLRRILVDLGQYWMFMFPRTLGDQDIEVLALPHEICGHQVAIDSATPVDDPAAGGSLMMSGAEPFGGYGGPIRSYGRMYGSLDFDDWGYAYGGMRPSRADSRPAHDHSLWLRRKLDALKEARAAMAASLKRLYFKECQWCWA
ncbi:hypothetical protein NL676_014381 [Syzygium grande]|nr:hypothetical protein NL676_014381 [Syzygium grande]